MPGSKSRSAGRGSEQRGGLLNAVRADDDDDTLGLEGANGKFRACFPFGCGCDVSFSELKLLFRGRWRDFRFRRERRLFDLIDDKKTGFVSLDEIILFRERQGHGHDMHGLDLPMLKLQPDLTRSLLALYHFDVQLDGQISFEEFLLLQDYLRQDGSSREPEGCWCVQYFRRFWLRWKKIKRGRRKSGSKGNQNSEDETPLTTVPSPRKSGEKLLLRKIRKNGTLQNISFDDESGCHSPNSVGNLTPQASFYGANSPVAGASDEAAHDWNSRFEAESGDAEEGDPVDLKDRAQAREARNDLLVSSLKSHKGRKRFIEWLYKLADTNHSDFITIHELVVFLKALSADGLNVAAFVDPSDDWEEPSTESGRVGGGVLDFDTARSDSETLLRIGEKIMQRYNEGNTGRLLREEFLQLATMVEREYELSDSRQNCHRDVIGPYRLTRTLGKGAEGVVKLGINRETGVKKAVKIVQKGNIASMSRIDREVEAMVMLDHPVVVSCDEVLETDRNIFLVMEYCAGGHLEDYISPTRPMSEAAARFYFSQLVEGLVYCHDKGVAHRDLRVENIMLDNKGNLKITDFGHAGIFQQGWDVFQTMLVGSVSHIAPEQVTGTVYSGEKIDIWSAGIILYIMLEGVAPFRGDTAEELLDNIRNGKWQKPENLTEGCGALDIVRTTLEIEQARRPTSAQLRMHQWMRGPKEKLVLAHCEFLIDERVCVTDAGKFVEQLRAHLQECDAVAREKTNKAPASSGSIQAPPAPPPGGWPGAAERAPRLSSMGVGVAGVGGEDDIEATVLSVEADEDDRDAFAGMRPVSVTVLLCHHATRSLVFKVTVTMMSRDGGQQKLSPHLSFDLQSGEASLFQKIFSKVRARYHHCTPGWVTLTRKVGGGGGGGGGGIGGEGTSRAMARGDAQDSLPLVTFAAATGLNRSASYRHAPMAPSHFLCLCGGF